MRLTGSRRNWLQPCAGANSAGINPDREPRKTLDMNTLTATDRKKYIQRDREAHHAALLALANSLSPTNQTGLAIWRKLKRIEDVAHAGATAYCNGEVYFDHQDEVLSMARYDFSRDQNAWETFSAKIESRVAKVLGGTPPCFHVNADARGYALKLASNDGGDTVATPFALHRDWGDNQILAPMID